MKEPGVQSIRKKVRFTYQDYLHIPGDKRYEIIEGDLHMVPAPLTSHQKISRNIYQILWDLVRKENLGEVLYAPVDVVLSEEDIVQPDILFISKSRLGILTEKNVRAAPDLVIEILSPSTKDWDVDVKRKIYEKYGVQEFWIVDPESRSLEVLQMTNEGLKVFQVFAGDQQVSSPLLKALKFPVSQIF